MAYYRQPNQCLRRTRLADESDQILRVSFAQARYWDLVGLTALTLQPHPELTKTLAREVYEFRRDTQGKELTVQAVVSLEEPLSDEVYCQWIFDFIAHVLAAPKPEAMAS